MRYSAALFSRTEQLSARVLEGRRVAVTHAREQRPERRDELGTILCDLGAEVIFCATIQILPPADWAPLDNALHRLPTYDWIVFTSRNAVEHFSARLANGPGLPLTSRARIAAIGTATGDALRGCGMSVDAMPDRAMSEAIPDTLGDVRGMRILLPRSDIARPELPATLRAAGATVDDVTAYRTVAASDAPELARQIRNGRVDAITFASGSALRAFAASVALPSHFSGGRSNSFRPRIVVIGPVTATSAAELGIPVHAIAREHTAHGLAQAVIQCFSTQPPVKAL